MALMVYTLLDIIHNQLAKIIQIKCVQVNCQFHFSSKILKILRIKKKNLKNISTHTDIDECTLGLSDCGHNSICTNTIGSFSCDCNKGYIHNITMGCHAMPNMCPDGILCDKNSVCKHVGGLRVSITFN